MAKVTLYERLGGYNAIAALVDSMLPRLTSDQRLARYFAGHCEDSMRRLRQLQVDIICQATGGPCHYLGRDMKTAHKGLGIDGADWTAMISCLVGVLDNFKGRCRAEGGSCPAQRHQEGDTVEALGDKPLTSQS